MASIDNVGGLRAALIETVAVSEAHRTTIASYAQSLRTAAEIEDVVQDLARAEARKTALQSMVDAINNQPNVPAAHRKSPRYIVDYLINARLRQSVGDTWSGRRNEIPRVQFEAVQQLAQDLEYFKDES